MIYCKDCKFRVASNLMSDVSFCTYYNNPIVAILGCDLGESKIITNADRIRAKSDEELAEWFFTSMYDMGIQCNPCRGAFDCKYCLLEWLKQEAET